ncbi:hypothetical protein EMIHUDRAFT_241678 [Emiliania huxleyi CCMP1516]|uniref:Fe2OG dioxygenase domain-containing protein n=2 Tax=Emiliania huxleyi TaxID=2903 RepID=A0A0D3JBI6_EMIH1|nr:hypothetical protein EMIHUDRAFT_241678 [Emiliania huxleyi CCMP1516]EOD20871.1 hypothetical protein EMIHUDRAFT_241678 [Emiliania huxleyi CCMP1516]|eukprot:XP_005773300.1 hypothetical protein EMIHUDRAFT_241678 [Emiliania huxleyi CCMP1516]
MSPAALGSKYLVLTFAWFLLLLASSAVCATPLHAAAQRDDAAALKRLLAESEDVDVLDARGLSPLHIAAVKGRAAAARLLLQHHASATRADAQGMAPLHLAALGGSAEVTRLLLQHGALLDAVEPTHESTALHISAARPRRDCDVAGVLLEGGASLDLKDGEGRTPYRIAMDVENAPCIELFRGWRSRPSHQDLADVCPAWQGQVFQNSYAHSRPAHVYSATGLFTPAEADLIIQQVEQQGVDTSATCSTDNKTAYERYLLKDGVVEDVAWEELLAVVAARVHACVPPVLHAFNCSKCVQCTTLVRRYRPDERMEVPAHRDQDAALTLVIELHPAEPAPASGGLYVQDGRDQSARRYTGMLAGDAVAHTYELLHGVSLSCEPSSPGCERYSLIIWFQASTEQCATGRPAWVHDRKLQLEANLGDFLEAARSKIGADGADQVDEATARRVLAAHISENGRLTSAAFAAALAALQQSVGMDHTAREAKIEDNLQRFLDAVRVALKRSDVPPAAARRAMQAHSNDEGDFADSNGVVDTKALVEAFAAVQAELDDAPTAGRRNNQA